MLHFPVYFRELDSPTWLQGTTENISYSGMLFHSASPLPVETTLELRLQLMVGSQSKEPSEIRCKGAIVRVEQTEMQEAPVALAVAIRDYRIVRRQFFGGNRPGNA